MAGPRIPVDTNQRAKLKWQEVLASYTPPELDPVIKEKVEAFIEKRSKELLK
jgi:trimethylamine:corrinoid methyltransferase